MEGIWTRYDDYTAGLFGACDVNKYSSGLANWLNCSGSWLGPGSCHWLCYSRQDSCIYWDAGLPGTLCLGWAAVDNSPNLVPLMNPHIHVGTFWAYACVWDDLGLKVLEREGQGGLKAIHHSSQSWDTKMPWTKSVGGWVEDHVCSLVGQNDLHLLVPGSSASYLTLNRAERCK